MSFGSRAQKRQAHHLFEERQGRQRQWNTIVLARYRKLPSLAPIDQQQTRGIVGVVLHPKLLQHSGGLREYARFIDNGRVHQEEEAERRQGVAPLEILGIPVGLLEPV